MHTHTYIYMYIMNCTNFSLMGKMMMNHWRGWYLEA